MARRALVPALGGYGPELAAATDAPWSASTAEAALRPLSAITLPAGWVAAPHM